MKNEKLSGQINDAIQAHADWKKKLLEAIERQSTPSEQDVSIAEQDNYCALGKWLYGEDLSVAERNSSHFDEVQTWHSSFHKEAATVLRKVARNDFEGAKRALTDTDSAFNNVSSLLISALRDWKNSVQ